MPPLSLHTLGLVVHPSRDVSGSLEAVRSWCERHDVAVVQVAVPEVSRRVAPEAPAGDCDLVVAIGGDGTMLAAMRLAMSARRPALGIACGSLGVLARVAPPAIDAALQDVAAGRVTLEAVPGLVIARADGDEAIALNDLSVVRAGMGQIRVVVHVDGVLYARVAGDGVVASTVLGSSAYTLAAGGPLLGPGATGFVVTPLATHGGAVAPIVVGPDAHVTLDVDGGYGGARFEIDGQMVTGAPGRLALSLRPAIGELVALPGQPSTLDVLRDRGIVSDSPRIVADDRRRDDDAPVRDS